MKKQKEHSIKKRGLGQRGIDIGGIAMVSMNNVPPHPSNYLQRAGRAGRRNEARSIAMTVCKANPHDQHVFRNSRWAFDTELPVPKVSLDSHKIIQRHVQSLLFSEFLKVKNTDGMSALKMECGAFFYSEEGEEIIYDRSAAVEFSSWCQSIEGDDESLSRKIDHLIFNSALASKSKIFILDDAASSMTGITTKWVNEFKEMKSEQDEILKSLNSTRKCNSKLRKG